MQKYFDILNHIIIIDIKAEYRKYNYYVKLIIIRILASYFIIHSLKISPEISYYRILKNIERIARAYTT